MVNQIELNCFDLLDLPVGWDAFDVISDIDNELGGRQYAPSAPVRLAVLELLREVPDCRRAFDILSDALPGEGGRRRPLVGRFEEVFDLSGEDVFPYSEDVELANVARIEGVPEPTAEVDDPGTVGPPQGGPNATV